MLKVAVIIRNVTAKCWKLRSNFTKNHSHVATFFLNCSHFFKKLRSFLKFTIIFVNFMVTFRILQLYFESCTHVIAGFKLLQSHFKTCSHVSATFNILQSHFKLWLQNVEICGHISNFVVKTGLLKLMARHTISMHLVIN